jgi:flagellin-specific chaperone FliS
MEVGLKIYTSVYNSIIDFLKILSPRLRTGEPEKDPARRTKKIEILKRLDKLLYRDRKERNPDRIPGIYKWFVVYKLFRN